ncbi:MAG: HAD hydrolase family protein [Eubacteriales bacterium]
MPDFSDILIVTDLDGTFFGKGGVPAVGNVEAVERFKAQGGHFTIATGRTNLNLKQKWTDAADLVNAPVIGCNGAMLCNLATDEMIASRLMDRAHVLELIDLIDREYPDLGVRISVEEGFLTSPDMVARCPKLHKDINGITSTNVVSLPLSEWLSVPDWYKVVVRGETHRLDVFRENAVRLWDERFVTSKSGEAFLEFQSPGTTKAVMLPALREYVEKKAGKKVKIYACGDFENDLTMLEYADVAVCPQNALDCVKEVADLCLCHHMEGLMANLIELIEKGEA